MKAGNFNELSDALKDNGYPESWVSQELIMGIGPKTRTFSIGGLVAEQGKPMHVKLDFDLSGRSIELKEMTGLLLKEGFKPRHLGKLSDPEKAENWVQEKMSFSELVPVYRLHDALDRGREVLEAREDVVKESINKNQYKMNRNSLEDFRAEAAALKVPQAMVVAAEMLMEQGVEKFSVQGQIPADKGRMDISIQLKKSGQSDYYYFNRFDIALSNAKPLEKDQKYLVISPDPAKKNSNLSRKFDSAVQAMDYFRAQEGKSELALGKFDNQNLQFKDTLATMEDGKVDYVKKEFQGVFYHPVLRNSHYLNRGKGFSVEQAANMLQGRSVFRDDLVSRAGVEYKAWNVYQFDQAKDKYGNYTIKQFGEGYGFDLKKELGNYPIKELSAKETTEKLIEDLKNGNRPVVTLVDGEGKEQRLRIEAVPRYNNLNLYEANSGRIVKREDYQLNQEQGRDLGKGQGKSMAKNKQESQQLSM